MNIFKKIFGPVLIFSALALNISCDADKLDLANPNQLAPETYFANEAQVKAAVNASYGQMQTQGMYNRMMWYSNDNMSHENTCNPQQEADKRQFLNFSHDASHGMIYQYWASCYRGIYKANYVINNYEKIDAIEALSDVMRDKYIGEAKFMRALYYYWLVTKFGDIPLYLEVPADGKGLGRSPKADIWAQIELDLTDAAAKLRAKADEEPGRATKGAAWALLGKARLYQGKYQEALTALNNVTGYSLEANYFDNFKEETENGKESIFEVQFNVKAGTSGAWGAGNNDDVGKNEATFRGQEYGIANWFNVYPSQDLWNEFESTEAGAIHDNGVKIDPRRSFCFLNTGDPLGTAGKKVGYDTVWIDPKNHSLGWSALNRIRGWNKYQNYYKWETEGVEESNFSGINMKVIRYADVILMKAECEAKRPGGVLADAVELMNLVRRRGDVQMPEYGQPAMNAAGFPVTDIAGFMKALEHERKIELCGEQVRLDDLIRWGRLTPFITEEITNTIPASDLANLVYTAPKNLLWPIPQLEIDANPNLTNLDQNPGY